MSRWKHKLPLADIYTWARAEHPEPAAIGARVAERIESQPWFAGASLQCLCVKFRAVATLEHFDDCMDQLYNWGDFDYECWIET